MTATPLNINIGDRVIATCCEYFVAPDGKQYRAVFGTVRAIRTAKQTMGIDPGPRHTTWYIEIGCMTIAGCRVLYAIKADTFNRESTSDWVVEQGLCKEYSRPCIVFDADAEAA
jgi:hypothetical protein